MKLLMISGDRNLAQGKKGAFYNTLDEFHKYWERIDIICPRSANSEFQIFENVYIHSSPWPLIFQPFWILKKGREIYMEHKFDLMTVHEYPPFYNGVGARLLWNKIKVPYILEIFHISGYPRAASLKEKIYRLFFYFFIKYDSRKAKAIRVMNSQVAEKLINLGIEQSKINLIPAIYVDLDIFKPTNLEKKYDLIFIGRLEKNKGLSLFLDAIKMLVFEFDLRALKVMVVGNGPEKNKMEVKSHILEIEDNIIFHGWAEDSKEVARLLNESKILVMTSYNEGGPRVVLEAIACGLPILATFVGIVADIIKHGRFGRIINWNSKDIAKEVYRMLSDESEYQKYVQIDAGIINQFEKKSAIKNYAEKLQNLI